MRGARGERQDDVGAGTELPVHVQSLAALRGNRLSGGSRGDLPPIENDPDIPVVLEALDQIVIERGVAPRNDEEVARLAHVPVTEFVHFECHGEEFRNLAELTAGPLQRTYEIEKFSD